MRSRGVEHVAVVALAGLVASCGSLDNPDLSSGVVAGRVVPAYAGGRVYLFGAPAVGQALDADGSFRLIVPSGRATVVAFDGKDRAGLLPAEVRGADVVWVGPAASTAAGGDATLPGSAGPPLPLAGWIRARAGPTAGPLSTGARFTVGGTDVAGVAPAASGDADLGPLPPGAFELRVTAPGFAESRLAVTVVAGTTVVAEVVLSP